MPYILPRWMGEAVSSLRNKFYRQPNRFYRVGYHSRLFLLIKRRLDDIEVTSCNSIYSGYPPNDSVWQWNLGGREKCSGSSILTGNESPLL